MRDAIGGLVNLIIIVVFMVIVSGYLAFNVNYTKAFRVKNKIISTFEEYEGNCFNNESDCIHEITDYMREIGYNMNNTPDKEEEGYTCPQGWGFCYLAVDSNADVADVSEYDRCYYKIATQITIDLPIINRVMRGLNVFQVTGDTKVIVRRVKVPE